LRASDLEQTLSDNSHRYRNVHENFVQKVEKGKVYDVVITSTGKEKLTGDGSGRNRILMRGLKDPVNGYRRISDTRLEFDEDPFYNGPGGWDCNAAFTIDNVLGGTARFSADGRGFDVTGKDVQITLTLTYNDRRASDGFALNSLSIEGTTWTRRGEVGSETHTVTLQSNILGGDGSKHFQLKIQGDNVIRMEDLWGWEGVGGGEGRGAWFDDVVCTASEGKFFDIRGNTAKFVIGSDFNTTSVRNGVVYKGPKLYNYKHKVYGTFLNSKGVSPDYPVFGDIKTINYEWSNVEFDVEGEYEFHFAHDAHGSVYLDGKEIIRGAFDDKVGVSAFDLLNFNTGQKKKVLVNKGKHTITVAPSFGRIGDSNVFADGLFRKLSDDYYRGQQAWENNPSAMAVNITRKDETFPAEGSPEWRKRLGKSWYENPLAISAALIPAPCKTPVKGKGVVTRVEILDPGVSYPPPIPPGIGTPTTYTSTIILTSIVPEQTGIGYTPGTPGIGTGTGGGGGGGTFPPPLPPITTPPPPGGGDPPPGTLPPPPGSPPPGIGTGFPGTSPGTPPRTPLPPGTGIGTPTDPPPFDPPPDDEPPDTPRIIVDPPNGGEFKAEFDPFGRLTNIRTIKVGVGFTQYPRITIESPTGINAKLRPVFRVVRDPIYLNLSPDRLIQVTDLVGIKQTGYYDGRPYYGAVFYKQGLRYAGYFETAGDLIRVYDTLQESVDARSVTPPSAIQRQGTDINSNDPRLNIPDTPENLI